ncbi:MAG: V-type H(+)-translocating pyrophosphatase, partial [Flavobacteriales bacterium]
EWTNTDQMTIVLEALAGFSLGAESIALFARVGGGIYTKAADVGADLAGKVQADIPEDDPRNPATIADNVGDNVGDVAGMGADLFGSYVATVLAAMVLGNYVIKDMGGAIQDAFGGIGPILLPMSIAGVGIIISLIGTMLVKISSNDAKEADVQKALNIGNWASILMVAAACFALCKYMLPETMQMDFFGEGIQDISSMRVFYACLVGLVVGAGISAFTEYYTGLGSKPILKIVQQSSTGAGTNIIAGLATGMISTFSSVLLFAAAIWASYALAGFYGVALAASAMMATTAMQLAIDAFGPIADNAGGIAEMSEQDPIVRERTDILDAVGNTTAATGKGFAIASAALTSLALFAAYVTFTGIDGINIFKAPVLAMLFVGGMVPVVFSALAMNAVGKAAMEMVNEVVRQFKEIPGIMEGTGKPEYDKCVDISTKASLKEMMLPGILTIGFPIAIVLLGKLIYWDNNLLVAEMLGGYMAGVTVSGVLWAIFQNNAGGAWDNAKKSFEAGVEINGEMTYKGSEAHKAAVTGDTVGDPFKDTSGPSMNILIKLTCLIGLVIAPILGGGHGEAEEASEAKSKEVKVEKVVIKKVMAEETADAIKWVGRKVGGSHEGTIELSETNLEMTNGVVTGSFTIDMNSIACTDIDDAESNADLVGHLKADDFFGVEANPSAMFVITKSEKGERGEDVYKITGDLTIKGITNPINFPAKITEEEGGLRVKADFAFDRTTYGIKYKSKSILGDIAGKFIYDDVELSIDWKF